jgi:hypothetical protein
VLYAPLAQHKISKSNLAIENQMAIVLLVQSNMGATDMRHMLHFVDF